MEHVLCSFGYNQHKLINTRTENGNEYTFTSDFKENLNKMFLEGSKLLIFHTIGWCGNLG